MQLRKGGWVWEEAHAAVGKKAQAWSGHRGGCRTAQQTLARHQLRDGLVKHRVSCDVGGAGTSWANAGR